MYKGRLSDLSSYVSEKIPVAALTNQTYIGVDNMLSNRGGVKPSEYVPEAGLVTKFEQGDILLGNIRPYFKKIWLAEFDGGCSPDVLVIRPKHGVSSKFLYAYLSTDGFFDYDMKGAKGSKMPRGDKDHIMRYEITIPDAQEKIGSFIININEKITNNNAICADLEGMAKLLYDYWFVQFDFPDENGKPYKSSGGKMVWNEELKREIPEGWEARRLEDLCSLRNGINYDKDEEGDADFKIANVRNITASTFLMDVNDFDVIHLKKEKAKQYFLKPEDIVIARSGTPGAIRLVQNPKNDTIFCGFIICCTPKVAGHRNYLAYTLKLFEGTSATKTGGSILQNVSQDTLNSLVICIPPDEFIEKFNIMITSILEGIQNTIDENRDLTSFRDFLLPMLMNGQVKVKGA